MKRGKHQVQNTFFSKILENLFLRILLSFFFAELGNESSLTLLNLNLLFRFNVKRNVGRNSSTWSRRCSLPKYKVFIIINIYLSIHLSIHISTFLFIHLIINLMYFIFSLNNLCVYLAAQTIQQLFYTAFNLPIGICLSINVLILSVLLGPPHSFAQELYTTIFCFFNVFFCDFKTLKMKNGSLINSIFFYIS